MVIGTVSQIEVDQSLIGDAFCVGQRLEVVDGAAVDVDGDLLFQPVRVWIFSWIQFADVIFISHTITSNSIKINALLGFGCLPCRDNTDAFCVGQRLEVVDGAAVDVDGDLLFQPVRVWIFSWIQFADVIFISHTITSNSIKINALLGFGCLPCRDNTDAVFVVTVAMAHNANFLRFDRSDNEEAIFFNGMIRIVK